METEELDRVIHQPIRTRIVVHLARHGPTDYVTLRDRHRLSDGHMTTHIRELLKTGYVSFEKDFVDHKKPHTTYRLTPFGRRRFKTYVKTLKDLFERVR